MKELSVQDISNTATVLSLNELGEPFFRKPTNESWELLKGILAQSKTILWVISSRFRDKYHSNMLVGGLRSAASKTPTLDFQFLNFVDIHTIEAHTIAETLLILRAVTLWVRENTSETLIASLEPEIMLDADLQATIPRLIANKKMNDRYNLAR